MQKFYVSALFFCTYRDPNCLIKAKLIKVQLHRVVTNSRKRIGLVCQIDLAIKHMVPIRICI